MYRTAWHSSATSDNICGETVGHLYGRYQYAITFSMVKRDASEKPLHYSAKELKDKQNTKAESAELAEPNHATIVTLNPKRDFHKGIAGVGEHIQVKKLVRARTSGD